MKKNLLWYLGIIAFFLSIISYYPLQAQTQFSITKRSTGDTLLIIEDGGRVGIGLTVPDAGLHVSHIDGILFTGTLNSGSIPASGTGMRLMWYPRKGAFRAGYADGARWDDANIGNYSMALGYGTTASGSFSTALGAYTTASGVESSALGGFTTAGGNFSTALGYYSTASGNTSIALGHTTTASGLNSFAMGREIEAAGNYSVAIALSDQNGLQVIQDSTMAIMGGRVGIGTAAPTTALEVADTIFASSGGFKFPDGTVQISAAGSGGAGNTLDQAYDQGGAGAGRTINADAGAFSVVGVDGALFTGTHGSGAIPATGTGTRLMWYPRKAAFRAGYADGTKWDDANIGDYSTAIGINTMANGNYSTALGHTTTASGYYSTAVGNNTTASGFWSTAMGNSTTASGSYSTAMGGSTSASGPYSMVVGRNAIASGPYSIAIGQEIEASGISTFAIGLRDMNGLNISQDSTLAIMGGRVGIGTTAPTEALEVADTIYSSIGGFKFPDGTVQASAAGSGVAGNTLDQAYDQGGAGAGRTITADAGAFSVVGVDGAVFSGIVRTGTIPTTGAGTRMMWYPGKAAFRAGRADGTHWDDLSIGSYSAAIGRNTIASGLYAMAMGYGTTASGISSTAMGQQTTASGTYATAFGRDIEASGLNTVAIGLGGIIGLNVSQNNTLAIIGGKVGIGTATPTAELQVAGTDGVLFTGTYGSGTIPASGAGTRLMWYPRKAAFRAGYVIDIRWDDTSIGSYSTAMGYNSIASGAYSFSVGYNTEASDIMCTAMGYNTVASRSGSTALGSGTIASGSSSTAVGVGSVASGDYSTAMGNNTVAGGTNSTAMGINTLASGFNSTAIGQEIEASGLNTVAISLQDMNGFNITQDNTMAIMGGKVGIESAAPTAELQVGGTDGVMFTGLFGTGTILTSGAGTRLMWSPRKAAFRAGYVNGTQWDNVNMGPYSVALGYNTTAAGDASVALGNGTTTSGDYCIATGYNTSAGFRYSTAMGFGTNANSQAATALGYNTEATGSNSTALGYSSRALALTSTAMGNSTTASGDYSTAMGSVTTASGIAATSMGNNTAASGNNSTAMGSYVESSGANSFTIGDQSTTTVMNNSASDRYMARFAGGYYLYTNANRSLGSALPAGANSWTFLSDSTKKENIKAVDGEEILAKISRIKLSTWNYIGQDPAAFRHYGPMAQDFYSAFGYDGIGTIGNDTTLSSADFDGINFIAIQALEKRTTELNKKTKEIEKLRNDLLALKEENSALKQRLVNMETDFEEFAAFMIKYQNQEKKADNKITFTNLK